MYLPSRNQVSLAFPAICAYSKPYLFSMKHPNLQANMIKQTVYYGNVWALTGRGKGEASQKGLEARRKHVYFINI